MLWFVEKRPQQSFNDFEHTDAANSHQSINVYGFDYGRVSVLWAYGMMWHGESCVVLVIH